MLHASLLVVPIAVVVFLAIVFMSLLLTPLFNMARMATHSNFIGYVTFAFSPMAILVPATIHLRFVFQKYRSIPIVPLGIVIGATAGLLFNLPGGIWMFLDFE